MEQLSVAEVGAELQLSRTVVLAMIRRGGLPATGGGPAKSDPWMVERAALEAWLDEQRGTTRRFVEENSPGWSSMWDRDTGTGPR